jgi:hypothetical protein
VTVTVPPGTEAEVHLPGAVEPLVVSPGEHAFDATLPEEIAAAKPVVLGRVRGDGCGA